MVCVADLSFIKKENLLKGLWLGISMELSTISETALNICMIFCAIHLYDVTFLVLIIKIKILMNAENTEDIIFYYVNTEAGF